MNTELYPWQIDAARRMHNGCVLHGNVGCGKSRTALAYVYVSELGGSLKINGKGVNNKPTVKKDIYIITTAKKRDTHEWEAEVAYFCLQRTHNIVVDSWNNIKKYQNVYGAIFIFDEQKTTSGKTWAKAFLRISRRNHWIMLSATPGDKYYEYIPVLIANGYYRSKSQFEAEHCVFKPYLKFKSIDHYVNTKRLDYYIRQILVTIDYHNHTERHYIDVICDYDKEKYKRIWKDRWDIYDNEPIEETGKLCYLLRRVSNDHVSRAEQLMKVLEQHKNVIIFYNFNYELETIKKVCDYMCVRYAEWNGQKHEPIPEDGNLGWAYIVQYLAASEGWNCIRSDTEVFYSQNYSYKTTEQAAGRIDRANTKFNDLYYYKFRSTSQIDLAIRRALQQKGKFNEKMFLNGVATTHVQENRKAS